MVQLHQDFLKFEERKIKVVVVCPEKATGIEKFLAKEPVDFDLIGDEDHQLADEYGQQVKVFKLGRMPSQILLDNQENKIFEHHGNTMMDIVENEEILAKV